MDVMSVLSQAFIHLLSQIPMLALYVVGSILAILLWKRSPQTSLCVLLACLLALGAHVAFAFLYAALPLYFHKEQLNNPDIIRAVYLGLGFVLSCIDAAAWGLLLIAALGKRAAA